MIATEESVSPRGKVLPPAICLSRLALVNPNRCFSFSI